jgi:hypothetical protein
MCHICRQYRMVCIVHCKQFHEWLTSPTNVEDVLLTRWLLVTSVGGVGRGGSNDDVDASDVSFRVVVAVGMW